jgi:mono/diheme cytochrome c family protein
LRRVLWIVLGLWVIVGVGVLLLALNGGPGGLRGQLHREGRVANRVRAVTLAVIFAAGLSVPILVAVANGQNRQRVGPAGITLTKSEAMGRQLFARTCANCHTLAAAAAVAHVGPNLDVLLPARTTNAAASQALVQAAINSGFSRGNGQMPAMIYTGQQAKDVAKFVAATAGQR